MDEKSFITLTPGDIFYRIRQKIYKDPYESLANNLFGKLDRFIIVQYFPQQTETAMFTKSAYINYS
jgi:hypothetical protein